MLTENEQKVYQFLLEYINKNLYAPKTEEICDGTGFKSKSTVNAILKSLQEKEYIEIKPKQSRAIRVVGYELRRKAE